MNVFCFAGNICKDIELRTTQAGKPVASFSLAINEGKDKTEFINCVAWEKTAELINQYCNKGDRLSGRARVQTRKWQDQSGQDRYTTEFIIQEFDFPPKRADIGSQDTGYQAGSQSDDFENDVIPF